MWVEKLNFIIYLLIFSQGNDAVLECHVHSLTPPTVKWLKKLGRESTTAIANSDEIFDVGHDGRFRIIQRPAGATEVVAPGKYVDRLVIASADSSDSGAYYCFVTNTIGYKYKSAFLSVLPKTSGEEKPM